MKTRIKQEIKNNKLDFIANILYQIDVNKEG